MTKKKIVTTILLPIIVLVTILGLYFMHRNSPKDMMQTIGIIEAREVNLSSKINEKISEIKPQEGDYVKKGDTVIVLDMMKIKAQYDQAEANLEVARASSLNAQADIESAKVRIEDTKRDLDRMSVLLEKKLVAQNDKDKAKTNYDLAVAGLNKAEAQGALAAASIKATEAALSVAKTNLDDTNIISTLQGVVTLRAFEPGEMAPIGAAILTVIDTNDVWVRVDVDESFVARIKLGDAVYVSLDALPREEFRGRVCEINSEGEFATQTDVKRGKQDIKTFRVKVKIEETKGILKPGMTAIVKFYVR